MPKNSKSTMKETNKRTLSNDDSSLCVVCFRKAEIFSIGECDHPVCYECSTRMRVLCQRTECPICRKDMAMVVFTYNIESFKNIQYHNMKYERRYSIYFSDDNIMNVYDTLLQHNCSECENHQNFRNFNLLKDHMRRNHEKFYCELCVENLKIFTHERKSYTRTLLAQHRRIGDSDNKSHRGHPLCEFCDSRFMDKDELFRHLRRDHFFCHFCDADGNHQYYDDYEALRVHFQTGHFLCEGGSCAEERFTSVFRTKLDLQAHTAQNHGHMMSKMEARQARTVDIAFTVNHRKGNFTERGRGGRRGEGRGRHKNQEMEEEASAAAAAAALSPAETFVHNRAIDINCVQDFPSLNGVGGSVSEGDTPGGATGSKSNSNKSIAHKLAQQNRFTVRASRGQALDEEEFPSLGSTTSVSLSSAPVASKPCHTTNNPSTSLHFSVKKNSGSQINSGSNVSIHYNTTNPSPTLSYSDTSITGLVKAKPRIGKVSHSKNITVGEASTGTRPKSAHLEEDFPMLQPSSKTFGNKAQPPDINASWGANSLNKSLVSKGPKKQVNNSDNANNNNNNSNNVHKNCKDGRVNNMPNNYVFESQDFPSLTPSSGKLNQKLNYSGRSSLTIPMKKPLPAKELKDKCQENDENVNAKGKKKKKTWKNDSIEDNSMIIAPPPPPKSTKKKPLQLSNVFENFDPNEPLEDFSKGKEGEYETVAPLMSSNIKMISSVDEIAGCTKKSELQIGELKAPEFDSEDFPSLGFISSTTTNNNNDDRGLKWRQKQNSSKEVTTTNSSSWSSSLQPSKKKVAPPGFTDFSSPNVPPGFADTKMTFTSSLGQNFPISPSSEDSSLKDHATTSKPGKEKRKISKPEFILPPDFEQRNNALINVIKDGCNGNDEKFNKFRNLAAVFRNGEIKGQQYYEKCKQIMGKNMFHSILPELLALLPDIGKQQEVYEAYRKVDKGQGCQTCFAVCAVCQQVLISDDFAAHMTKHEFSPDEYPSLRSSGKSHPGKK